MQNVTESMEKQMTKEATKGLELLIIPVFYLYFVELYFLPSDDLGIHLLFLSFGW